MIEFAIEGDIQRKEHLLVIGGRCYKGPLRPGDHFRFAYRYEPKVVNGEYSSTRSVARTVNLKIEKIYTYGRFVDELSNGVTAELTLHSVDDVSLSKFDVLADDVPQ